MSWRSNRGAVAAHSPAPLAAESAARLQRLGVSAEFLTFLRQHGHTVEQTLLFFDSGGRLKDLEAITGYRQTPAAPDKLLPPKPVPLKPASVSDPAQAPGPSRSHLPEPSAQQHDIKKQPRQQRAGWRDEFIAHGGLTLLFALVVIANGLGTVFGVMSLVPPGPLWMSIGLVSGLVLHVIISRIEIAYLQWRYLCSWFVLPLLAAMVLDVGTSVQGLLWLARSASPDFYDDGLPADVWAWQPLFTALWRHVGGWMREQAGESVDWTSITWPLWSGKSVLILVIMGAIALGSERLLRWSYQRLREIWDSR